MESAWLSRVRRGGPPAAREAMGLHPQRRTARRHRSGLRALSALAGASRAADVELTFAYFKRFDLPERLRATAWRTSTLKADSSTSSPSWMSIARRTLPSRLELKRRAGSFRDAPLAKVSFTTFL